METQPGRSRTGLIRRVVVTGSECTGKTTLARSLAGHYHTVWVPEYSREFVVAKRAPVGASDVPAIARGQIASEEALARRANRVLVQDTDLLSTIVYSRHYFGDCPSWIEEALEKRRPDLYLLADIDMPWVPEPDQRDRGDRREEMQGLFRDALRSRNVPFADIRGPEEARLGAATRAVDQMMSGNPIAPA
jgi:NadR type nicotinamide-nucleotide adenylyltransferase